jgi:hypothetical protein
MAWFDFLVVVLATYRLAALIATETGPGAIFAKFRAAVGKRWPPDKDKGTQHWIDEGVNCPLCVGFYMSFAILGLWQWELARWVIIALAVAGLQVFMQKQGRW